MAPPATFVYTERDALWYLHLSSEQEKAYDEFRARLSKQGLLLAGQDDKYTLLRFMKARQWDVDKALAMYSNMVAWRSKEKVEALYLDFVFEELGDLMPFYPHYYQ